MGTVRYEVLGPLAVRRGGAKTDLGPVQRQRILAALLLKANQAVSPAELVAAAWETSPPPDAEQVVSDHVAVLRDLVDPHRSPGTGELLITLAAGDYLLCVEPGDSDLAQFARDVEQAGEQRAAGNHQQAAQTLRTALARWRGTPLDGFGGPVFVSARQRLAAARQSAQDTLNQIEWELGGRQQPRPAQPIPPPPPPAPVYWQLPQTPQPPRPSVAKLVVLKLLGAAVPVVTIGMFGWLLTGLVAIKRRSIALGLSAAGYLGMTVWFIAYAVIPDNPEITDGQTVVTLLYLLAGVACAVQAAVVIGSPKRRSPQPGAYAQPGAYPTSVAYPQPVAYPLPPVASHPLVGYGSGLIDLNAAPAELLATIPGVTRQDADSIVFSRTHHGRFRRIDDLWTRGLLPVQLAPQLTTRLVVIDVQDSVGGAGQTS